MAAPDPIQRMVGAIVPRAVDSLDLDAVLAHIDLDELARRVDVDEIIGRVDVNSLLGKVDVNALLDRVDVDSLLDRVDVDALLDRVDVDALLQRADVDGLMDRVDVDRLLQRVDITGIVRRAQVDALVSATAGGLGNRMLDLIRRQLVGLDIIITRVVDRVLHRRLDEPVSEEGTYTGQVAGGATRLAGFLLDLGAEFLLYSGGAAVILFLASLFTGQSVQVHKGSSIWQVLAFAGFAAAYQWVGLAVAGRTPGRAVAGLRVTAPDGTPLGPVAVTRRVAVYPFSFVLGLGLVGIVASRRHRALHDIAAPSLVRYDWGDRPARMPAPITRFLERQGVQVRSAPAGAREGSASSAEVPSGPEAPSPPEAPSLPEASREPGPAGRDTTSGPDPAPGGVAAGTPR